MNAIKIEKSLLHVRKFRWKSCEVICVLFLALSAAITWATLASETLHHGDFVHNPPIIMAVAQDHSDGQKSRHVPKIVVSTVIVTSWYDFFAALVIAMCLYQSRIHLGCLQLVEKIC